MEEELQALYAREKKLEEQEREMQGRKHEKKDPTGDCKIIFHKKKLQGDADTGFSVHTDRT